MAATRVTLGVSGGVAAYKAAELVRELQRHGLDVHVVMTRAAQEFIQPLTFSALTGHKVITSLWDPEQESEPQQEPSSGTGQIEHIAYAQAADALVIAPATAHILGRLAHGLADDFLTTMYLATTAPVILAPAMNVNMWNHPATRANIKLLRERGAHIVEPESGYLACGMTGAGRLAPIEEIAQAVLRALAQRQTSRTRRTPRQDLAGETLLVTAGGTREAIDPVRYLGNRSSGKMGYALAEAAEKRGAEVILVSAPAALSPPARCAFVPVTSAAEMQAAVMEHLARVTVVIKAAAVADFRASSVAPEKLRRNGHLHLNLEPTPDIVRSITEARTAAERTLASAQQHLTDPEQPAAGGSRPATLVIAFAAETAPSIEGARRKMLAKGADAIVLNDVSRPGIGFDSDRNAAAFITASNAVEIPEMSKREMADRILDQILALRPARVAPAR